MTRGQNGRRYAWVSVRAIFWLALLGWGLSCGSVEQPVVYVTLSGLATDSQTVRVAMTLNGHPEDGSEPTLRDNLSQFQARLPRGTQGELGINVTAQGPNGCTSLAGNTRLTVGSELRYDVIIQLSAAVGCQLTVRKTGEGATQIVINDGSADTSWDFPNPDPPGDTCPIEALVMAEKSMTFPLGTTVRLREVTNDSNRGSYVAVREGCTARDGTCEVTIGPDTTTIFYLVSPSSVCSPSQVCWEHPLPQGQDLLRTAGLAASDTWAVGDGQILHYNGTYWAAPRRVALSTSLRGILPGNTTNSLVAVGRAGTVLRLRDNHWACPEHPGPADLNDVWGVSLDDFWVVGSQGTLLHWAGNTWTAATAPGLVAQELKTVSGRSASDVWAIGESGTVLHYDGTSWTKIPFPTTDTLYGLWIDNDGRAWVVGDRGITALINGTQVQLTTSPVSTRLRTIYSIGGGDIWAAGDSGALLRYTGSGWNQVESGTRQNLYSISGSSSSSLWAVGGGGTFLHYGGLYWTLEIVGRTARPLYGLAGYSNTQSRTIGSALAVGEQGTVLRYTGADWVTDPTLSNLTPRILHAVAFPSPSEIWIVGDAGTMV